MKAITIKQPFATLIAEGLKEYEFRTWKTNYRGDILIHAGNTSDKEAMKRFEHLNLDYPLGCIIAKASLTDCVEIDETMKDVLRKKNYVIYEGTTESDNWHGYGFKLENICKISPIPTNGKLSLWDYEGEIVKNHEKRILLFDLDGTLLRNDKTISKYTLNTLSKCKENGYLIGISTSRSEQNCLSFFHEIKPDILISSGGALVRVNEKIVSSNFFSISEVKQFIETVKNICGLDCEITVDTLDGHYWNYKIDPKIEDKSWGDSIYTDFNNFEKAGLKICVEISNPDLVKELCSNFPDFDVQRFSDGEWYKFTKSGITKEKAIIAISEACNSSPSEIIAFGDDYVDIGMLKLCGIGVAMGNSIQEVKDIADEITLSNEEDGVAVYLEKILNLN